MSSKGGTDMYLKVIIIILSLREKNRQRSYNMAQTNPEERRLVEAEEVRNFYKDNSNKSVKVIFYYVDFGIRL